MEVKEISILIPVYNVNVVRLVKELSAQCSQLNSPYEIIVVDDASVNESTKQQNNAIVGLINVKYSILEQNIGRSAIRNLLAKEASYAYLLFLDCDSLPLSNNFIRSYFDNSHKASVLCGGRVYEQTLPGPDYTLHWNYGAYRESQPAHIRNLNASLGLMFNNIWIKKEVYLSILLDEAISTYGHEDTKFGYELQQRSIEVLHIDNPVVHTYLENNQDFLAKSQEATRNLVYLYCNYGLGRETKLIRTWEKLNKYYGLPLFRLSFDILTPLIKKNLFSPHPSLLFLDLYKLRCFDKYIVAHKAVR